MLLYLDVSCWSFESPSLTIVVGPTQMHCAKTNVQMNYISFYILQTHTCSAVF